MAYYWLPKKWRTSLESKFLSPKQRKFIDAGERFNDFGNKYARKVLGAVKGAASSYPSDIYRLRKRASRMVASNPRPSKKAKPSPKLGKKVSQRKSSSKQQVKRQISQIMPGTYKGNFKRTRRVQRRTRFPAVNKTEHSLEGTSADTVYLLHATHPPKQCLRMIGMAMVAKFCEQKHMKITHWQQAFNGTISNGLTSNPAVSVYAWIQRRAQANSAPVLVPLALPANDDTYLGFADKIADGITLAVDAYSNDIVFTQIYWEDTALDTRQNFCRWDAFDLTVSIQGSSHMNVQNRTTAGGGTPGGTETTSIFANPLIGKKYAYNGFTLRLRHMGYNQSSTHDQLAPDATTGSNVFASNRTGFSAMAHNTLKQPPSAKNFYGCYGEGGIRLEPGAIKKSTVSKTVTKSFNGWIKSLYSYLSSGTTITGMSSAPNTATGAVIQTSTCSIGQGRMLAMEKVADMGSLSTIELGAEVDSIFRSVLTIRQRRFIPAVNDDLAKNTIFSV